MKGMSIFVFSIIKVRLFLFSSLIMYAAVFFISSFAIGFVWFLKSVYTCEVMMIGILSSLSSESIYLKDLLIKSFFSSFVFFLKCVVKESIIIREILFVFLRLLIAFVCSEYRFAFMTIMFSTFVKGFICWSLSMLKEFSVSMKTIFPGLFAAICRHNVLFPDAGGPYISVISSGKFKNCNIFFFESLGFFCFLVLFY